MTKLPGHDIKVHGNEDKLPAEAEKLFEEELASSRKPLPKERADRNDWRFACVCAVTDAGNILGGVHFDMGPINSGPLAHERVAILERVLVRPDYRRQGLGFKLMRKALEVGKDAGCSHVRCNVQWDNTAGIALYRKCGFALVDINEPGEGGEYFVVKPLTA